MIPDKNDLINFGKNDPVSTVEMTLKIAVALNIKKILEMSSREIYQIHPGNNIATKYFQCNLVELIPKFLKIMFRATGMKLCVAMFIICEKQLNIMSDI